MGYDLDGSADPATALARRDQVAEAGHQPRSASGQLPAQLLPVLEAVAGAAVICGWRSDSGAASLVVEAANARARSGRLGSPASAGDEARHLWPGLFTATDLQALRAQPAGWHEVLLDEQRGLACALTVLDDQRVLLVLRSLDAAAARASLLPPELTAALLDAASTRQAIDATLKYARQGLGAAASGLVIRSLDALGVDTYHISGATPLAILNSKSTFDLAAPLPMSYVLRTGRALWLDRDQRAERFPEAEPHLAPYAHTVVLPLRAYGHSVGAWSLHFDAATARPPRAMLLELAELCGQVLDRTSLNDAAAQRQAQLEALVQMSAMVNNSLDLGQTLDNIVDVVVPHFGCGAVVHLLEEGRPRLVAAAHRNPQQLEAIRDYLRAHPVQLDAPMGIGAVLRTAQFELVTEHTRAFDKMATSKEQHEALTSLQLSSWLAVPLLDEKTVVGAFAIFRDGPEPYAMSDVPFVSELANQAVRAIQHSRQYGQQVEVARVLQENLLPAGLPKLPGVDLAACCRPGGAGLLIGGDFYDAYQLDEQRFVLTIGDVCGKGLKAAGLTSLVRHTARAGARLTGDLRRSVLAVNEAVLDAPMENAYCTLASCLVERLPSGSLSVQLALAGHPPALLRKGGHCEEVGALGTMLGVTEEPTIGVANLLIHPGEALVLVTDGVTERRDGDTMFQAVLHQVLADAPSSNAIVLVDYLERAVKGFSPEAIDDDLTIVALSPGDS